VLLPECSRPGTETAEGKAFAPFNPGFQAGLNRLNPHEGPVFMRKRNNVDKQKLCRYDKSKWRHSHADIRKHDDNGWREDLLWQKNWFSTRMMWSLSSRRIRMMN